MVSRPASRLPTAQVNEVLAMCVAVTPVLGAAGRPVAGVGMDELPAGQWLSARVCSHCGHPPDDFVDEDTMVG